MRLHLVHDRSPEALSAQHRLVKRCELKISHSLADAIAEITLNGWLPELVVIDLQADRVDTILLQTLIGRTRGVPIVMGACNAAPLVEAMMLNMPSRHVSHGDDRLQPGGLMDALIEQQRVLGQSLASYRASLTTEVERIASQVAEAVTSKAMESMLARVGVDDGDGIRLAVRFARAWEDAKHRFLSAFVTGVAGAFLIAVGAGIVAMLKGGGTTK